MRLRSHRIYPPRRLGAHVSGSLRAPAVLGAADGLGIVVGLIAGLAVASEPPGALWHAALAGGLAELVSMAAAQRQADASGGWRGALLCGTASAAACVAPAIPYLFTAGLAALLPALTLAAAACGVVAWLRPEKGARAVLQTYGLTAAAGVLCAAVSLI